jgi:hypothetical protein
MTSGADRLSTSLVSGTHSKSGVDGQMEKKTCRGLMLTVMAGR